jgi:hypothetical protein
MNKEVHINTAVKPAPATGRTREPNLRARKMVGSTNLVMVCLSFRISSMSLAISRFPGLRFRTEVVLRCGNWRRYASSRLGYFCTHTKVLTPLCRRARSPIRVVSVMVPFPTAWLLFFLATSSIGYRPRTLFGPHSERPIAPKFQAVFQRNEHADLDRRGWPACTFRKGAHLFVAQCVLLQAIARRHQRCVFGCTSGGLLGLIVRWFRNLSDACATCQQCGDASACKH